MNIFETMNKIEYNLRSARMPFTVIHGIVFFLIIMFEFNGEISWPRVFFVFFLFLCSIPYTGIPIYY